MKLRIPVLIQVAAIFILLPLKAQLSLNLETANLPDGTRLSRVLEEFDGESELSPFGGWKGRRLEETGFFYAKKVDGSWYIIDPDGYLFYSVGINSVVKGGGFTLPDSLQNIGCNTMGCWSDETINTGAKLKIAYTPRWNMMLSYKNTSDRTKNLYDKGIIPVFDPGFSTFCQQLAYNEIAPLKDDPYILGYFSDNELPVYDNSSYGYLLDRFLGISEKTDPNYLATHNWMLNRKGAGYAVDPEDRLEFHGYVMGSYYNIVNKAIKKYDPNHLYLGSRLHGAAKTKAPIFREAGKYVDVISINVYGTWTPAVSDMNMWTDESGKPFMVTEFYAKAVDSGLPNTEGAGWLVNTQADRVRFFENFTLALMAHTGSVGFHHFKYIDKETFNTGLVSSSFEWYDPLKQSFHKIGKDIYRLREFMLKGYSDWGDGSIYTGINYQDKARLLGEGEYSSGDLAGMGIPENSISSIRIRPGYRMILYSGDNFSGDSLIAEDNIPSLSAAGFSLRTSSLKICPPQTSMIGPGHLINDYTLYPNPASGMVYLDIRSYGNAVPFEIHSTSGAKLAAGIISPGNPCIDISSLNAGFYLLNLDFNGFSKPAILVKTD